MMSDSNLIRLIEYLKNIVTNTMLLNYQYNDLYELSRSTSFFLGNCNSAVYSSTEDFDFANFVFPYRTSIKISGTENQIITSIDEPLSKILSGVSPDSKITLTGLLKGLLQVDLHY